jgi:hypothetical protein
MLGDGAPEARGVTGIGRRGGRRGERVEVLASVPPSPTPLPASGFVVLETGLKSMVIARTIIGTRDAELHRRVGLADHDKLVVRGSAPTAG